MDIRNVYGYSLKTETVDEIFNWLSCDFNGMEIQQLLSKDCDGLFPAKKRILKKSGIK